MFGDLFLQSFVGALPGGEMREAHKKTPQEFQPRPPALRLQQILRLDAVRGDMGSMAPLGFQQEDCIAPFGKQQENLKDGDERPGTSGHAMGIMRFA
jgi:hypothetical protein